MKNRKSSVRSVRSVLCCCCCICAAAGVLQKIDQSGQPEQYTRLPTAYNLRGHDQGGFRKLQFWQPPAAASNAGVAMICASARRGYVEYAAASLPPFGGVALHDASLVYTGGPTGALVHIRCYAAVEQHRALEGALRRRYGQPDRCAADQGVILTWIGTNTTISYIYLHGSYVQLDFIATRYIEHVARGK